MDIDKMSAEHLASNDCDSGKIMIIDGSKWHGNSVHNGYSSSEKPATSRVKTTNAVRTAATGRANNATK